MKILFFGSSKYCLSILESLAKKFKLTAIIAQPDKPVGRKKEAIASAPKQFALSHNIEVYTPNNKKELLLLKDSFSALKPDLAVVADYGLIIPPQIFNLPKHKTLNIHFSRLPQFRGPSPVQYTILTGQKSAWISVILMDIGLDTGDVIWQKEVILTGNETSGELYDKLFNLVSKELPNIISLYANNEQKPQKQDTSKATYTKLFSRQDGYIPFRLFAMAVKGQNPTEDQLKQWGFSNYLPFQFCTLHFAFCTERVLRAFTPWPGVWTEVTIKQCSNATMKQKKRLKILKAHVNNQRLVLDEVQLEGKKPVSWMQFAEGHPDFIEFSTI